MADVASWEGKYYRLAKYSDLIPARLPVSVGKKNSPAMARDLTLGEVAAENG